MPYAEVKPTPTEMFRKAFALHQTIAAVLPTELDRHNAGSAYTLGFSDALKITAELAKQHGPDSMEFIDAMMEVTRALSACKV